MPEWAIVFDVDGVLLELTRDEEEIFFDALSAFVPTEHLSRDWNSYLIRNDEDIIAEILARNKLHPDTRATVTTHYIDLLASALQHRLQSRIIPHADELLKSLAPRAHLGVATANLLAAARLRLHQCGLWRHVEAHAQGADGGGHKSDILARLLPRLCVPPNRVIFVGDNLNDLAAARANQTAFIAFSQDPPRRAMFQAQQVPYISGNHHETKTILDHLMA
jgi:phosphoglycolate phosphatase-like HAD superfamily hydrolase